MTYRTKYPEVEKMLRKYSKARFWINENNKTIEELVNAGREFTLIHSANLTGLPKGNSVSDPTALYTQYKENAEEDAEKLRAENIELQRRIFTTEAIIKECLEEEEAEIILLKYKEHQTHKQIIWTKKMSKRELFRLLNGAYMKLGTIWRGLA